MDHFVNHGEAAVLELRCLGHIGNFGLDARQFNLVVSRLAKTVSAAGAAAHVYLMRVDAPPGSSGGFAVFF
jgi:hypothetical protein